MKFLSEKEKNTNKNTFLFFKLKFFLMSLIYLMESTIEIQTDFFDSFQIRGKDVIINLFKFERNELNTTVDLLSGKIGDCSCDLTAGICDYLCCCDKDCPKDIQENWVNNTSNICIDNCKINNLI